MGTMASPPQIDDIITEDGILCKILSSLPLREAVRTSVLSPRWRRVWPGLTSFNLNAITVLDVQSLRGVHLESERAYNLTKHKTDNFIQAVNSVLHQNRGTTLVEFVVRFFLDKTHAQHIDAWVRFAVQSKAKSITFNLFRPFSASRAEPYDFPCQLLGSSPILRFTLMCCFLKLPLGFDGLRCLKELSLCDVHVSEEDFNTILSNCSLTLEKLCVLNIQHWKSISVPHSLTRLRVLLVMDCFRLTKIEINAVNLLQLKYVGFLVDFKFPQSSKLNDALMCFKMDTRYMHNLDYYLIKLSSSLFRLQSLALKFSGDSQVADLPKVSSRFTGLTCLNCEWNVGVKMSLLHLAAILDAAPILEKLKLSLQLSKRLEDPPPQTSSKLEDMLPNHPRKHLKTIELSGFYFDTWQIEIAIYLLKNAGELELMTIKEGSMNLWMQSEQRCKTGMQILKEVTKNDKLLFL